MVVIKLYLLAYNAICCIVWSFILYEAIKTIYSQRTLGMSWDVVAQKTWNQVGTPLKWIQAAAVLEIVHAAIGFVRSSAGSAVMQVTTRMVVIWIICNLCPPAQQQFGLPLMVIVYGLAEVPRYAFYAFSVTENVPRILIYLRYTLFIVLYPVGAVAECINIASTLAYLSTGVYSIEMPNAHNLVFSVYYLAFAFLLMIPPGLCVVYTYMLAQRKRALAKLKTA